MKKQGQSEGVKGKVLSGFFLLLIIALAAVVAVIQLASQLTPPDSGISQSVIKLTLVSNMLSKQIEADGQARAYITTGEKRYLYRYRKQFVEIKKLADSLKYSSTLQPEQYKRMLAVDSLLKLKKTTMENFFRTRIVPDTISSIKPAIHKSPSGISDSGRIKPITAPQQVTAKQGAEKGQKEGSGNIFKKLWNNITGKKNKPDSLQSQPAVVPPLRDTIGVFTAKNDTTLEMVKSQLQRMGAKERLERQMNVERELLLLKTNQVIMDEIRKVLFLFEKEEISRAIEGAENSKVVLKRLWYTALALTSAGLFTMLVFVILIWKDLARSAFYRKQLEKARQLAEQLLKVKEQFLANMSHEIRTPITSIIGFTERLSVTRLSNEQSNYLNYINTSSEHLLGLVDDLLDYSRIESGKFNLESIPFAPADLLTHAFETLRHKGETKGLTMIFESNINKSLVLSGDPLRLRQIIYNLLNNSLKFTEKGSIILKATAESEGHNTTRLSFSVTDTGIGIPAEKQQEIFEEFTQVDAGITRKYGGSGLGLAICRKLTELMNGNIQLKSNTGEGTCVAVAIPLERYQGEYIPEQYHHKVAKPELTGVNILLAEDDPTTRILLNDSLVSYGASVDVAIDGEQAWKYYLARKEGYQLVMTDIQMPQISGPELASLIDKKAKETGIARPPVMGLTAHALPEDLQFFKASGIDAVLIKPFRVAQLEDIINQLIETNSIVKTAPIMSKNEHKDTLNYDTFMQFAGNDTQALNRILYSLADSLQQTSAAMQEAFEKEQINELALLAHRMLPNVRNLGAMKEVSLLKELESLRTQNITNIENIGTRLQQLIQGMKEIETILRKKTMV